MKLVKKLAFLWAFLIVLVILAVCASLMFGATVNNLKVDRVDGSERITLSCIDHRPPQVHVLNPASGAVVVVDCERAN